MEELTELDINSLSEPTPAPQNKPANNHGVGLELLMNNAARTKASSNDIDKMASELTDLADNVFSGETKTIFTPSVGFIEEPTVQFMPEESTARQEPSFIPTWNAPSTNYPQHSETRESEPQRTAAESTLKEKKKYLKKLEDLERKGIHLSKRYTVDSSLTEIKDEYEIHIDDKKRKAAVAWQGNALMAVINGIEFLNERYDPFDIKLEGLSDQIQENLGDYDEIFSELYDKYSGTSTSPELKLIMNLVGSMTMVHISNSMFKSAIPGADTIFRENPELFQSFQAAAMKSMSQSAPGFSNFISQTNNIPSHDYRNTPSPKIPPSPPSFSRPDLNASADIPKKTPRAEMRGPENISSILSGLKTKSIDIRTPQATEKRALKSDSSTISLEELRELTPTAKLPKKSVRKNRSSNSNTISLDI